MAKSKHKGSVSPSARSLKELRRLGYIAQSVEKRIPYKFITQDYIHCIDIIAFREGEVIGVQATSGANVAARINKALDIPELVGWLKAGCAYEVWGWSKKGARGKRKLWELTRRPLTLGDVPSITLARFLEVFGTFSTDERNNGGLDGGQLFRA